MEFALRLAFVFTSENAVTRLFFAMNNYGNGFTKSQMTGEIAMRYFAIVLTVLFISAGPARAMDGIVSDTGDSVTVEDGIVFHEGDTVAVFSEDGTEHDLQVMAVTDNTDTTSVDFIDEGTGDAKTIDFVK